MEKQEKIDLLFKIIGRFDHYIGSTNFKVGLMLSFNAGVVTLVVTMMSKFPPQPECPLFTIITATASVLASASAISFLLLGASPNTNTTTSKTSLLFFGHVASRFPDGNSYAESLDKASEDDIFNDLSNQAYDVANIAKDKFEKIGHASKITLYATIPSVTVFAILFVFV